MKKLLLLIIIAMMASLTVVFASCTPIQRNSSSLSGELSIEDDESFPNDIPIEELFKDVNMKKIYSIYCDYAEEMQIVVLSFDEWFELVKGDEFQIGIIPLIQENAENGYWEISYNNGKGWNTLFFKTQTEMQKNCNHTFEKWITLLDSNDFLNGIRYRECIDCGYKQYDFKLKHRLELVEVVESTCITNGYHLWKCKDEKCDFSYKEELPLGKHKYVDGVCIYCGKSAEEHTPYEYFVFIPLPDEAYAIAAKNNRNMPENVILPNAYEGKPVTVIAAEGFWNCDTIKTLVIPEGYKEIENSAFYGCDILHTVEIPKTLEKISHKFNYLAEYAREPSFCMCTSLKRIEVDAENQYYTSIQGNLYSKDTKTLIQYTIGKPRTYFEIPEFVTKISDYAFYSGNFLTSITIPDSVTSIGLNTFYGCSSLRYKIKDNIKYLGNDNNPYLYLAEISSGEFTTVSIDENCKFIGSESFEWDTDVESLIIPDSVIEICATAFYSAHVREIIFSKNSQLKTIGDFAFTDCSLDEFIIPASVTSIGGNPFFVSDAQVSIDENNTSFKIAEGVLYTADGKTLIAGVGDYYYHNLKILNTVTTISDVAFFECHIEGEIVIPASVTSIGNKAFTDCNGITKVLFEEGSQLTSIGEYAFYDNDDLMEIVLPNSLTIIENSAFKYCDELTVITIPSSVTFIGEDAFYGCDSLVIYCEAKGKPIGWAMDWNGECPVIWDCNNGGIDDNGNIYATIEDIRYKLKDGEAKVIGQDKNIQTAEIPETLIYNGLTYNVTSIEANAFKDCNSLTYVSIPNSVTLIGEDAFYSCNKLQYNKNGDGLYYLGNSTNPYLYLAESNNFNLTSVNIDEGCRFIASDAFYNCSSLTSIKIPDSVTSIGSSAFYECYRLVEVINKSSHITVTKGSEDNGCVGYYALSVSNCDDSYVSRMSNDNGYIVYTEGEEKILVGYFGSETNLVLPSYITQIYKYAFYYCSSLTSVVIGDSVNSIGGYAFYNCSSLTSVEFVENSQLTSIGSAAFRDCSNLTSIVIPNDVTSIGDYAFYYCDLLIIYCEVASKPSGWDYYWNGECPVIWDCNNNEYTQDGYILTTIDGINYAINDSGAKVTNKQNKSIETVHIPSTIEYRDKVYNVTSIEAGAFESCNTLTSVIIPNSITFIGNNAFKYCYNLEYNEKDNLMYLGNESNPYLYLIEEDLYSRDDGDGAVVITDGCKFIANMVFYNCSLIASVIIPDTVISIGESSFRFCSSLTFVEIGNSITSIGEKAFESCGSLTSIVIPNSVISIGEKAFESCASLQSVIFEENSSLTTINSYVFYNCISLASIKIPNSIKNVGYYSFAGCESLTSVEIGSGVKSIDITSFMGCYSLTNMEVIENNENFKMINGDLYSKDGKELILLVKGKTATSFEIQNSVTTIGTYAFNECSYLESVKISSSVTTIGDWAFAHCHMLSSVIFEENSQLNRIGSSAFIGCKTLQSITIPNTVTSIGNSAFNYCTLLENIIFEEGSKLTTIAGSAFSGCKSLKTISLPNTVTSIGNSVFMDCTLLECVIIPNSVTYIGECAFAYCDSLTIYCEAESQPESWDSNWNLDNRPVVWGYKEEEEHTPYEYFTFTLLEDDTYSIAAKAVCNMPAEVILPSTYEGKLISTIGSYAFRYCDSLTSIEIPNSVISIGDGSFVYCGSLTSVVIPNSVTSIGNEAFVNCSGLTSIEIPDSVTSIGDWAFAYCNSLTSIVIPNSVTSIGYEAFDYCESLTSIEVSEDNETYCSINGNVYSKDAKTLLIFAPGKIGEFYVPDSVTSIGKYAFYNCDSLTSVVIGDSVNSIGGCAFSFCDSLTSVVIGKSVTSIGDWAFAYCDSLTIYCEAESQPESWDSNWNPNSRPVLWGYEE